MSAPTPLTGREVTARTAFAVVASPVAVAKFLWLGYRIIKVSPCALDDKTKEVTYTDGGKEVKISDVRRKLWRELGWTVLEVIPLLGSAIRQIKDRAQEIRHGFEERKTVGEDLTFAAVVLGEGIEHLLAVEAEIHKLAQGAGVVPGGSSEEDDSAAAGSTTAVAGDLADAGAAASGAAGEAADETDAGAATSDAAGEAADETNAGTAASGAVGEAADETDAGAATSDAAGKAADEADAGAPAPAQRTSSVPLPGDDTDAKVDGGRPQSATVAAVDAALGNLDDAESAA